MKTLSCVIAITPFVTRNKGSERQTLRCCDFAGWDSKEQFTLITELTAQQQDSLEEECPGSPEQQGPAPDTVDRKDSSVPEEKVADILPGERLSVAVACHAKWVFFPFFLFFFFILTWSKCYYVFNQEEMSVVHPTKTLFVDGGGGLFFFPLRNLGSSTELLLLHFSSFTIGRRLEVTVASEEEKLLQPSKPYSSLEASPNSAAGPSHVITVAGPRDSPRYKGCCYDEPNNSNLYVHFAEKEKNLLALHQCTFVTSQGNCTTSSLFKLFEK